MKKVFYDNRVAKVLLCLSSCDTITLGPFVVSELKESEMRQYVRNHECTHARQWIEMAVASGMLIWLLVLLFDISVWWFLLAGIVFYLWYGAEWLVRLFILRDSKKAYKAVSFEREAYDNEYNPNYLENSQYFAWIKYLWK
ncbi:hypothetical protein AAE250_22750 [Bacteroides sp. GD17]|jgi:hypothetical protein|uniref:hypothetical protein n=1 Tax=Bacteroides sp. GD17 TaxID=3139826 RepID=UPI0025FE80DD|nr:hypothetical protein [uncultured Bacteroides sp.]